MIPGSGLAPPNQPSQSAPDATSSAGSSFTSPPAVPTLSLHQRLLRRGYRFSPEQAATFYAALKAKGFVILSGLSGTGKTRLAQEFAAALGLDEDHFLLEPVKPDWRDNTGLMGYWNPVTGEYAATRFLRFLLAASEEYGKSRAPTCNEDLKSYIRRRLGEAGVQTQGERHRNALQIISDRNWTDEQIRWLWQDRYNGIGRLHFNGRYSNAPPGH